MVSEDAVSEVVAVSLLVVLVVALAAVIFVFVSGSLSHVTHASFVAPRIGAEAIDGTETISLFNEGGDVMYLDAPELHYNVMGVYVDTPEGTFRALPDPNVPEFRPGTTLYVYRDASGYRITGNPAVIASGAAEPMPEGEVGVRLVDENSQILITKWENAFTGPEPVPTPTPTPTIVPTTGETTAVTTLPTTAPTTRPTPVPTTHRCGSLPLAALGAAGAGAVLLTSRRRQD